MELVSRQAGMIAAMALALAPPSRGEETPVAQAEEKSDRSISASGQFLVYGADGTTRGVFCSFAESIRESLAKELNTGDRWKYPIVVQIHSRLPANTPERFVSGKVRPTEDGFRFQVDALLANGFVWEDLREELLRLLVLERMLGADGVSRSPVREGRLLPHWLHFGVLELVRHRQEGVPNDLYESILNSHRVLPVLEVIEGDPTRMNSVSRIVFRASAAALVKALLEMDSGSQRLVAFMEGLPGHSGGQLELLSRVFPDLARSETSLEKWWALEVKTLGRSRALDFLDAETTQERLQEALTVKYMESAGGGKRRGESEEVKPVEKICHLSDYKEIFQIKKEERLVVLSRNEGLLLRLTVEAFPLYRSLIADYRRLLAAMVGGRSRGLEEAFKQLDDSGFALGQLLRDVEDHMNWYEATQSNEKSTAFRDYRRAVEELRRNAPPRNDRVTKYLDSVEEQRED